MKTRMLLCALVVAVTCFAQTKTVKTTKEQLDDGTVITISSTTNGDGTRKINSMIINQSASNDSSKISTVMVSDGVTSVTTQLKPELPRLSAENMPEFTGGSAAMMSYLIESIHYPKDAKDAKKEGRVICSFIVTKEGKISDAHVVKSSGTESMDAEALRVINAMPDWTPGTQDGEPVDVHFTLPIIFKLK